MELVSVIEGGGAAEGRGWRMIEGGDATEGYGWRMIEGRGSC